MSGCRRLTSLPIGISQFKSLKILDLDNCDQLEIFASTLEHPETLSLSSICHLSLLEKLMLDGSNIEGIPLSIKNLSKLIRKGCILLETISSSRDALIQGLKSDNHVMTYSRFSYFNCLKLNQNSRKNIISEFQLRVMDTGIKSILPYSVLKVYVSLSFIFL